MNEIRCLAKSVEKTIQDHMVEVINENIELMTENVNQHLLDAFYEKQQAQSIHF